MDDLRIVVEGVSPGPAMVLVHPWGSRLEFWDECVDRWKAKYRIVRYDLRGAGGSRVPDTRWTVDDHARDLALVSAQAGPRPLLVACAIGSLIAARHAATFGSDLAGLVLCDTAPQLDETSRTRTQARIDAIVRDGFQNLIPQVVDAAFHGLPRDARYDRYLAMFAANDPVGYIAIASGMMGTDNRAHLPRIACPTLVMAGQHDRLLPPELAEATHRLIPNSEFIVVPEAAHFPPFQAPKTFCDLVDDFVARRAVLSG